MRVGSTDSESFSLATFKNRTEPVITQEQALEFDLQEPFFHVRVYVLCSHNSFKKEIPILYLFTLLYDCDITLSYLIDCWFFPICIRIHSFLLFCFFLFRISFWLFSYLLSPTHSREFNRKEVLGSSFLFCSLLLIWWFNLLILIFVSSGKLNHYVVLQLADNH